MPPGWRVLEFTGSEVVFDLDGAVEEIRSAVDGRYRLVEFVAIRAPGMVLAAEAAVRIVCTGPPPAELTSLEAEGFSGSGSAAADGM